MVRSCYGLLASGEPEAGARSCIDGKLAERQIINIINYFIKSITPG